MNKRKTVTPAPTGWRDCLLAYYRRTGWRGFSRLYDLLKPVSSRREIITTTRYGSRFLLHPYDIVDAHVMLEGFYESEVLEALRPELARAGVVLWVVGANFGLHAITAKFLHPSSRVVAFEPNPDMAARYMENCRLNQVETELHTYALAGRDGVLSFHANASGNPGSSTLHPVEGGEYEPPYHVAVATPKSIIEAGAAPPPDIMLVDAEGAEEEILTGFGASLHAPTLRRLVFEAPNDFLKDRQPAALYRLVVDAGFVIEPLTRREDTAHIFSNFLARRPSP